MSNSTEYQPGPTKVLVADLILQCEAFDKRVREINFKKSLLENASVEEKGILLKEISDMESLNREFLKSIDALKSHLILLITA